MNTHRYDLHVHTKETSRCGHIFAADMVNLYKQLGYSGIAITDHLHEEYIQSLPSPGNWDACVDAYLKGYKAAAQAGKQQGVDVILGLEIRFADNDNDFLIYGVEEDFLRANPYLYRTNIAGFWEKYSNQLLILQAHPYRGGGVDLHPDCLHGIEVINCNPRHNSHNEKAVELSREYPHLLRTCASDAHRPGDEGGAALLFSSRIANSLACKKALERGGYRLECPAYEDLIKEAGAVEPLRGPE